MNKQKYPQGWYSSIPRSLSRIFDVSENYIRDIAKGKRKNANIKESIHELCKSHSATLTKIQNQQP